MNRKDQELIWEAVMKIGSAFTQAQPGTAQPAAAPQAPVQQVQTPQPVGYIAFDNNGNVTKLTDANTYNTFAPGIKASYLPYTADGSVINTNGSIAKLTPRNFTTSTSKGVLAQIQKTNPQFMAAPTAAVAPAQGVGPKQQSTPLPKTADTPTWMQGMKKY